MATDSERPRLVLGVPVTIQTIALLLTALGLTTLLGIAVLSWLESTG